MDGYVCNMAKVVMNDRRGVKEYLNDDDEYHRTDGPAIIWRNGNKYFYTHGKQSCTTRPSDYYNDGSVAWAINDQMHRNKGPALDGPNGRKTWWKGGLSIWPKL